MRKQYQVYLDVCCLNRPFDDQEQERVRFEGEAVLSIIERVRAGSWQLIGSEAIELELQRLSNVEKLDQIQELTNLATIIVTIDESINLRSQVLESWGFGLYDSFHIACAEALRADVLLTTDDRLLRRARRYGSRIQVPISNPVAWLMDTLIDEGDERDDTD
jgi:predicted nucleic acid-binding protein